MTALLSGNNYDFYQRVLGKGWALKALVMSGPSSAQASQQ